jgi:hypothetical protein
LLSVSSFDLYSEQEGEIAREAQHFEEKKIVNQFEEKLDTWIFVNETSPSGYQNFRVVTDEVVDFRARVKGELIDQVIKQGVYEVFFHPRRKRLVALCRKDEAFKVSDIFNDKFGVGLEKHRFNILRIIEESTDVRGARFDVEIETVTGVSLKGSNINSTQYYANMLASGQLKGVLVTYDHGDKTVTFRVSVDGTLLFYTALTDHEYLDFIDMLYSLETA